MKFLGNFVFHANNHDFNSICYYKQPPRREIIPTMKLCIFLIQKYTTFGFLIDTPISKLFIIFTFFGITIWQLLNILYFDTFYCKMNFILVHLFCRLYWSILYYIFIIVWNNLITRLKLWPKTFFRDSIRLHKISSNNILYKMSCMQKL